MVEKYLVTENWGLSYMQFRVVFCWTEKLFYVELIKHVRISPPQIFCCIWWIWGGFNKKGPQSVIYLNSWFSVGETAKMRQRCGLTGRHVLLRLNVKDLKYSFPIVSLSLLLPPRRCGHSVTTPMPFLLACCHAVHHDGYTLALRKHELQLKLFWMLPGLWGAYHSNEK